MSEKKYFLNRERWIFGLESMRDHCSYMLECEWDDLSDDEIKYYDNLREECQNLLWKNSHGGLTGKEVERVKDITVNREFIRYNKCLAAGMEEKEAGKCFDDDGPIR